MNADLRGARGSARLLHCRPGFEVTDMMRALFAMALMMTITAAAVPAQDLATRGKDVYTAQKCGVCHAVAGTGNKRGSLDAVGSKLTASDLRSWITDAPAMAAKAKAERKPAMKAYMLAKDDLDALVAYLQTLK
jgi:mono/diheme cytochrome c family protein